jgi:acetyl-CoA carboxylase biotin carboxyl carrier protein
MSLTADDVREILRLLEESTFDELVLETESFKIALRRGGGAPSESPFAPGPASEASPTASDPEPRPWTAPAPAPVKDEPGVASVTAPLLGVFYRAPKPGAPPYIDVGQRVEADTVIGLIEVMKLMNTVRAGVAGEVVEICAENGVMVEYEEILIRVRVD